MTTWGPVAGELLFCCPGALGLGSISSIGASLCAPLSHWGSYFRAQCKSSAKHFLTVRMGGVYYSFGIFVWRALVEMDVCAVVGVNTADIISNQLRRSLSFPSNSATTGTLCTLRKNNGCGDVHKGDWCTHSMFIRNCKKISTCAWFKVSHCGLGDHLPALTACLLHPPPP